MSETLIPIAEVCRRVGMGRSTIYRRIKAGLFPRPLDLDAIVRWKTSDVDAWIDSKKPTSASPAKEKQLEASHP